MTRTAAAAIKFQLNARVSNEAGAWVTLRFDAQGGYRPGLGPTGIYYAEAWSPDFAEGNGEHTLTQHWDRKRVEKSMRQWLVGRPLTAEQLAALGLD